jgi:hypothetical protein
MPTIRAVDAAVFDRPVKPSRARTTDPEMEAMARKLRTITDADVVYEVRLEDGEKAPTVRGRLLRAAKLAGVEIAVRKSPRGWYVGLMTPERRARQGRRPRRDTQDG